jgi:hypothetical protein
MNDMDLPLDFPLGTRFWRIIIDAFADVTNGQFMLLDGSIVSGRRAKRLRRRITDDGVEISEAEFRQMAPPSLREQIKAIDERMKRDPHFAKAMKAAAAKAGLFAECENVARDAMQNAPDPEDRRKGAELLLTILGKKQKITDQ